jgi:hypothetical protein
MPASQAWLIRPLPAVIPKMRSLAPRQITDLEGLGQRLSVYAQIQTPTVLLGAVSRICCRITQRCHVRGGPPRRQS